MKYAIRHAKNTKFKCLIIITRQSAYLFVSKESNLWVLECNWMDVLLNGIDGDDCAEECHGIASNPTRARSVAQRLEQGFAGLWKPLNRKLAEEPARRNTPGWNGETKRPSRKELDDYVWRSTKEHVVKR